MHKSSPLRGGKNQKIIPQLRIFIGRKKESFSGKNSTVLRGSERPLSKGVSASQKKPHSLLPELLIRKALTMGGASSKEQRTQKKERLFF